VRYSLSGCTGLYRDRYQPERRSQQAPVFIYVHLSSLPEILLALFFLLEDN